MNITTYRKFALHDRKMAPNYMISKSNRFVTRINSKRIEIKDIEQNKLYSLKVNKFNCGFLLIVLQYASETDLITRFCGYEGNKTLFK